MSTYGERVKQKRKELKLSQTRLGKKVGLTQQAIGGIEKMTECRTSYHNALARALSVSADWLETGRGEEKRNDQVSKIISIKSASITHAPECRVSEPIQTNYLEVTGFDNINTAPDRKNAVPLISWVQAGELSEIIDIYEAGDAQEWLPCPTHCGPHTFALRVEGDSMTSPHGRSYPEGIYIYVDPDCALTNGCRVVAKRIDTNQATFKVYVEDAGKRYLRPLNPQYPIIEMDHQFAIIGLVIGSFMRE